MSRASATHAATYTVHHYPHGIAVFGSIPLADLASLVAAGAERGLDLLDMAIARDLGANIALVSNDSGAAWLAELRAQLHGPRR